ncbi:MFS transporter [Pseudobacillus badius]|uniref:MFS transporter n=1 Tax=Bacillus badius TaxID=1455 RepID=UPI003CF01CA5
MLIFMLTFQFFVNALSFVLESSFNLYLSDQPHKDIAFRNVFLLSAKTIGFFVGPILFLFLESTIYMYFAAFFLILLLYEITKPLTYNMEFEGLTLKNLKMIKKLPLEYALVVIVDGMFFPVIMNYSFIILKERYAAEDITISIFWLVGGLSVIASNFILRKIDIDVVKLHIFSALIVLNVGLVVMYFAQNSYWYLFGFFLLSLINPVFMSMIKSHFLTYFEPKHRSIALAFINTFNQLGTILLITLTILLLDTITGFQTKYIIAICLILGVIRFLFVIKILSEKEKEQFSNEANGLS